VERGTHGRRKRHAGEDRLRTVGPMAVDAAERERPAGEGGHEDGGEHAAAETGGGHVSPCSAGAAACAESAALRR